VKKLFLLAAAIAAFATEPFVSAKWLKEHLEKVVVLDVSEAKAYAKKHIPGAINAPISLWRERHGNYSLLRKEILKTITNLGLSQKKPIVIYAHHEGKDKLKTSYVAWALQVYGINNTSLLDGGLKAWKEAGYPLESKPNLPAPSNYTAKPDLSLVADKNYVLTNIGKIRMIDARPAVYYFGAKKQSVLSRAGHIPHATSYFWKYSFDEKGLVKPKEVLKEMFINGLGLDPSKEVITYCTGGLETSMNWYILNRVLGFQKARLYDASMKEWANDPDTPMTKYRWE
jgi:thiosulfate/3-mercaptopyruvate sulfurtransferase